MTHTCDCGRQFYTLSRLRLHDCDSLTVSRRTHELDLDGCKDPDTHEHPLAPLVGDLDRRGDDKLRLAMATLLTAGKRTIADLVRDVFDVPADESVAGSSDYMLARRFYTQNTDYFLVSDQNGSKAVEPSPALLDLITEGISQRPNSSLSDRDFARSLLDGTKSLTEGHKRYLSDAIQSYVDRIDQYRVFLEPRDGFARPAGRDFLRTDYKTRFNDSGRARMQIAKFKRALELAPLYLYDTDDVTDRLERLRRCDLGAFAVGEPARPTPKAPETGLTAFSSWLDRLDADNVDDVLAGLGEPDLGAVMLTVTTDPKLFDSLLEMIETMNDDHNRLQSWLATQPTTKTDGRQRWKGRLPYLKAFEFTEDGKPHLHLLFFGVPRNHNGTPWLVDKNALSDYCNRNLERCRIVDLEPLEYERDLGDRYDADAGFVSPYDVGTSSRDEIADGQTAGQYLGKYLSATYGGMLDLSEDGAEYLEDVDAYDDKMQSYRLALYWATDTSILTFSKDLEELALHDDGEDWDVSAYTYVGTYHIDDAPDSLLTNSVPLDFLELRASGGTPDFSRADRPPPSIEERRLTTKDRLLGRTRADKERDA